MSGGQILPYLWPGSRDNFNLAFGQEVGTTPTLPLVWRWGQIAENTRVAHAIKDGQFAFYGATFLSLTSVSQ